MKLTKTEQYNILIEEFKKRDDRTLDIYDEALKERLKKSPKTIQRLIEEFMLKYNSVVEVKGRRRKTYKLATPMDIITEGFEHFESIGWLFQMAHDADPTMFKELEELTKKEKHIYMFKNTPFEDLSTIESNQTFQRLKRNIEAREYTKITFYDDKEFDNLKPIKLVFVDGNWYITYVDNENLLKFGRINFIKRVDFGSKIGHFQPSSIQKHLEFLEKELQNSMTLYGAKKKTATIKTTPFIAKYFKKDMKKFLSSQKFIKEEKDGSVIFTLEYTQPLEVLPFIQKWLPDLTILEPQELKAEFKQKLQKALEAIS